MGVISTHTLRLLVFILDIHTRVEHLVHLRGHSLSGTRLVGKTRRKEKTWGKRSVSTSVGGKRPKQTLKAYINRELSEGR